MELRKKVMGAGVKVRKKMSVEIIHFLFFQTTERLELQNKTGKDEEDEEYECYVCNANLYVSLVKPEQLFNGNNLIKISHFRSPMKRKNLLTVYLTAQNI